MVRLVPREKDVIPIIMVLLVNIHLIKKTQIIFSCCLAGYRGFRLSIDTNGTICPNSDVSPLMQLLNMPSIKDTLIIPPSGLSGYKRTLFFVPVAMQIFPTCFTLL